MNTPNFFTLAMLLTASLVFGQVRPETDYLIVSNFSNLKLAPESPNAGSNMVQVDRVVTWQFVATSKANQFRIRHSAGRYLAVPPGAFSVKKLLLADKTDTTTLWELIPAGAKGYQIRSVANKAYIGNSMKKEVGTAVLHFLNPSEGAFWQIKEWSKCIYWQEKVDATMSTKQEVIGKWIDEWRAKNPGQKISQELAAKFEAQFQMDYINPIKQQMRQLGCK